MAFASIEICGEPITQIIALITQEYALLASDRRLTYGNGPKKGQIHDDDTCKLVSLCGTTGIAYSGIGEMKGGVPTHEWIAKTLADTGCNQASCAEHTLIAKAPDGVSAAAPDVRWHTFLLAGWAHFEDPPVLYPYWAMVTNAQDAAGKPTVSSESFNACRRYLRANESFQVVYAGKPVSAERLEALYKNIRRDRGPKETLRLLVDEVINTSKNDNAVGSKVLGFCIPKKAAQRFSETGQAGMLAAQPNAENVAFTYFEEGYSELRQYGPTMICGGSAITDVITENDPANDTQIASFRLLAVPKAASSN